MKKILSVILAISLLFTFASCGTTDNDPAQSKESEEVNIPARIKLPASDVLKDKKIGCSICYKGDIWCQDLSDALEKIAAYYGATLECQDGELDDQVQASQIEKMTADGCDVIFVDPVSSSGSSAQIKAAMEKNIPLLVFDEYLSEDNEKIISTVSWDKYDSGVLIGNYFIDYLRKNNIQKASILGLTTDLSESFIFRMEGFKDTVSKADDIQITVTGEKNTNADREASKAYVSSITDPYDFVICDVDMSAFGAVEALREAGKTDVKVFSLGGYGDESFNAVKNKDVNYISFVHIDPWLLASQMFETLIDYYDGKSVSKETNIDQYVVDSENCEQYWEYKE